MRQGLLSRLFRPTPQQVDAAKPLQRDVAWAESQLWQRYDFMKYNPDDLIGRKGHTVYKKMMLDEQVKAVVRFKRDAITSRNFFFDYDDDVELPDEEKDRRIALFTHIGKQMRGSFSDALNYVMMATWQGFSLTEIVLSFVEYQGDTWIGIERLMPKPFDSIEFEVDEYGIVRRIRQELDGNEQDLPADKFIYYVQNPDMEQHYGQSELREAYRSYWAKDNLIKFWNLHLEKHASGVVWAQPSADSALSRNSQEYAQLQAALSNMQTATSMILPGNVDLNFEKPLNTNAYERALAYHDQGIAKALLVPNLLGVSKQDDTGSYSQSATQMEAFLWTLDADSDRLEAVINEQLFQRLARLNFADGMGPVFRLYPASEKKKLETINTWNQLVTGGSVEATDTDENHLRKMLDFPEKGEPINRAPPALADPGNNPAPDDDEPTPIGEGGESVAEETINGAPVRIVPAAALARATKRVALSVIERESEKRVDTSASYVGERFDALVSEALARINEENLGSPAGGAKAAAEFKFSTPLTRKLKTSLARAVRDMWALGDRHARDELNKARGEAYGVDMERLEDIAGDYLEGMAFRMLGHLTDDARDIVRDTLAAGIRYSWAFETIREKIVDALTRKGFLDAQANAEIAGRTLEEVQQALEGAGLTRHRLRTAIRTNGFEAINEARYSVFTDPGLGDFVEALEYTAILDSRTTEICRHLDGRIYPKDDPAWDGFRPPNHFNCRSLLVPVTAIDTDATGKDAEDGSRWSRAPTIQPQEGFGGS